MKRVMRNPLSRNSVKIDNKTLFKQEQIGLKDGQQSTKEKDQTTEKKQQCVACHAGHGLAANDLTV
jgi:hypothetical protein